MIEPKMSPFSKDDLRETYELEERVLDTLKSLPSRYRISQEQLEQLDEMPLGDRMEMLRTIEIILEAMSAHAINLRIIEAHLNQRPKLRIASSDGLDIDTVNPRDIISIWENSQRNYYYVLNRWPNEPVLLTVKLKKNLQVDSRLKKSFYGWSHKIGPVKLKLSRVEKRGVSPQQIGAEDWLIERWKDSSYTRNILT